MDIRKSLNRFDRERGRYADGAAYCKAGMQSAMEAVRILPQRRTPGDEPGVRRCASARGQSPGSIGDRSV